jgi:hypothetical protein
MTGEGKIRCRFCSFSNVDEVTARRHHPKEIDMAQYMLLLHQAPNYNMDLPREKMLEMTRRYMAWADGLRQKGKMVGGEKLTASGGRQIKVKDGKPVASDGPYAEAKDVIGGYFILEAKDLAEAESIARDCPHLALSPTNWAEIRPIEDMAQVRAAAG